MVKGLDTVTNIGDIAETLKDRGYSFVVRYLSLPANQKKTSRSEITAIGNAGLKRVVVFQNKHNAYNKFGAEIAAGDAELAVSQARDIGHMSGVIYFAVDYDAARDEIYGNIKVHFEKLKSVLNRNNYELGVYGSSLTCKTLKELGIVSYTWLNMSAGWGFQTRFTAWNIHQTHTVSIGGIAFDENEANSLSGAGAW